MPDTLLIAVVFLVFVAAGAAITGPLVARRSRRPPTACAEVGASAVAIGTVRTVSDRIMIDVESVSGQRFVGRLRPCATGGLATDLRPGVVLLVAFDPQARDTVALADDMVAVRSAFDRMLVRKGLVTADHLELIRHGTRSRGVVTGMRATGEAREDYREVELHLMVRRPEGGQFPAHEKTLVPASALAEVAPGSVVDAYYRHGDETAVAVCVAPT